MTRDEFAVLLSNVQKAERDVREEGQKEYAHDENNCFANFDSDSDHGVSRVQSIMTHLNKHYRGIQAYVNGHRSQREDIRGRIKDARLYLALLWAAIDEEEKREAADVTNQVDGCECGWNVCQCLPCNGERMRRSLATASSCGKIQAQLDRDQTWKESGVLAARAEKQLTKNRVQAKGLEMCDCDDPEFCYCNCDDVGPIGVDEY